MGIGRASWPLIALEHLLLTVLLSQLFLIFLVVFVFTEDCHSRFLWSPASQCNGAVLNQNPSPSLCKEWETCAMGIGRASWPWTALEHLRLTVVPSQLVLIFLVVFVFTEDCHRRYVWSRVKQCFGAVLNQNPCPSLCKEGETCAMGIGCASWLWMALEHLLLTVLLSQLLSLIFLVVFVFTEDCHSRFFWSPVSQCFGAVLNHNPCPSLCKE